MRWCTLLLVGCVSKGPTAEQTNTEGVDETASETTTTPADIPTLNRSDTPANGTVMFGMANMPGHGYRGEILEIDRDGELVWKFTLTEEMNPGDPALKDRLFDVEPQPDGTILFSVNGIGYYRINKAGEVLWHLADPRASHDVDLLENGNILATHANAPAGEPMVVEYSPDGEVVWSWDGSEFFTDPRYSEYTDEIGAWAHANSVRKLKDGTIRICVRNFNTIVIVNKSGEVVDAYWFDGSEDQRSVTIPSQGIIKGSRPHEVALRRKRNRYVVALRSPARAVEFKRDTSEITREWRTPVDDPTYGKIRDINPLPNRNWLITTYDHIVEVNRKGKIMWQFTPTLPEEWDDYPDLASLYKATFIDEYGNIYGN